jgi:hypothetical protein
MKKFIGKPYAGKPHVRIDEGEKRQRRFSLLYRETPLCFDLFSWTPGLSENV